MSASMLVRARGAARGHRRGGPRGAATRRTRGAHGPVTRARACARTARSPRGRAARPLTFAEQRATAGVDGQHPLGAAGLGDLGQPLERIGGSLRVAATGRGLDEVGQHPGRDAEPVRVLRGALGGGQRVVVAAEAVVPDGAGSSRWRLSQSPSPRRSASCAARLAERVASASRPPQLPRASGARRVRWLPVAATTASASAASDVATASLPANRSTMKRSSSATGSRASAPARRASSTWRAVNSSQARRRTAPGRRDTPARASAAPPPRRAAPPGTRAARASTPAPRRCSPCR